MSVRSSLMTAPLSGWPLGSFTFPSSVVVWAQAEQANRATRPAKESCCRNRAIIMIRLLLPRISIPGYYELESKTAEEQSSDNARGGKHVCFPGRLSTSRQPHSGLRASNHLSVHQTSYLNVRQFFTIERRGSSVFRVGFVGAVLLSVGSGLLWARDISKAEELYRHTAYEESLSLLDKKS